MESNQDKNISKVNLAAAAVDSGQKDQHGKDRGTGGGNSRVSLPTIQTLQMGSVLAEVASNSGMMQEAGPIQEALELSSSQAVSITEAMEAVPTNSHSGGYAEDPYRGLQSPITARNEVGGSSFGHVNLVDNDHSKNSSTREVERPVQSEKSNESNPNVSGTSKPTTNTKSGSYSLRSGKNFSDNNDQQSTQSSQGGSTKGSTTTTKVLKTPGASTPGSVFKNNKSNKKNNKKVAPTSQATMSITTTKASTGESVPIALAASSTPGVNLSYAAAAAKFTPPSSPSNRRHIGQAALQTTGAKSPTTIEKEKAKFTEALDKKIENRKYKKFNKNYDNSSTLFSNKKIITKTNDYEIINNTNKNDNNIELIKNIEKSNDYEIFNNTNKNDNNSSSIKVVKNIEENNDHEIFNNINKNDNNNSNLELIKKMEIKNDYETFNNINKNDNNKSNLEIFKNIEKNNNENETFNNINKNDNNKSNLEIFKNIEKNNENETFNNINKNDNNKSNFEFFKNSEQDNEHEIFHNTIKNDNNNKNLELI
jgi:hypothetical protein